MDIKVILYPLYEDLNTKPVNHQNSFYFDFYFLLRLFILGLEEIEFILAHN